MSHRRFVPLTLVALGLLAAAVAIGLVTLTRPASALPPAGTDVLGVTAQADVVSRLGQETINFSGNATIVRQDPHMEDGIEVADLEITSMSLTGASLTGPVNVSESATLASTGELRSLQASDQFPAASFFDVFVDVSMVANPSPTLTLHNNQALTLRPRQGGEEVSLDAWPPIGVTYQLDPIFGVDNDGDTLIDEDTADEDGDGLVDEDRPGFDPDTPGSGSECGNNPDCDDEEGEDPPASWCIENASTICDDDGDGLIDEDPDCIPFLNVGNTHLPAGVCLRDLTLTLGEPITPTATFTPCPTTVCTPTFTPTGSPTRTPRPTTTPTPTSPPSGPENPTFSVAPGGPSGFHPAALLGLGGGAPGETPVTGNDNFLSSWTINSLPFIGTQSTTGFTVETDEPKTSGDGLACITVAPNRKGGTAWYRFVAPGTGSATVETSGSGFDTVVAVYSGVAVGALTQLACDDDGGPGLQSMTTFPVTQGVTYHVQAGGFVHPDAGPATGNLRLSVYMGVGAGAGIVTSEAIACGAMGLSSDGCDDGADGDQDDIDALSFGLDLTPAEHDIAFSVAPGSQGLAGSGVAGQAACSPPQPQADEFISARQGTNSLFLDGDGQGGACPGAPGLGLIEQTTSDDLDGLTNQPISQVDEDGDGALDRPVYISLAAGSPSLATLGRSPADIIRVLTGVTPGVYAAFGELGLQATDDIDGLCINDRELPRFEPAVDWVSFSLAPGSPTLAAIGAGPADVLVPGSPPRVLYRSSELGLRASDDLDAMKCFATTASNDVKVPVGDIWYCDETFNNVVCDTKIDAGDTVVWNWVGLAPHNVVECGGSCPPAPGYTPLFESAVLTSGSFEHRFTGPGTYLYYCEIHGIQQSGRIIVNGAGPTPTSTRPPATPTPTRTPRPAAGAGDANKDGRITAIDAQLIVQYSAGLLPTINDSADANEDGTINAIDAQLVLQYVAGLLDRLPP